MPHVDLLSLLEKYPISHPSSLVKIEADQSGRVSITIKGTQWWKGKSELGHDKEIIFVFEGVSDGFLDVDLFDDAWNECLESFCIFKTKECEWLAEDGFAIYCSSPLPEPLEIFVIVHDYLKKFDADISPVVFLNAGDFGYLADFKKITSSTSYLLGKVPPVLCGLIEEDLARQGVKYNKLGIGLRNNRTLLVQFGRNSFFCDSAMATFED